MVSSNVCPNPDVALVDLTVMLGVLGEGGRSRIDRAGESAPALDLRRPCACPEFCDQGEVTGTEEGRLELNVPQRGHIYSAEGNNRSATDKDLNPPAALLTNFLKVFLRTKTVVR